MHEPSPTKATWSLDFHINEEDKAREEDLIVEADDSRLDEKASLLLRSHACTFGSEPPPPGNLHLMKRGGADDRSQRAGSIVAILKDLLAEGEKLVHPDLMYSQSVINLLRDPHPAVFSSLEMEEKGVDSYGNPFTASLVRRL
ncbi:hypothetical protein GOP47_0019684 [Adiantum capillus-veneris]|uniref:Uncharacterized protein n=1 Tax=Adiantum capillus-veneris TaxID=13818 RepID=A0A9D4Z808_ADICA|nr:hypothetical protein GOP47_0019684 [Adiantum capillus-veneris]